MSLIKWIGKLILWILILLFFSVGLIFAIIYFGDLNKHKDILVKQLVERSGHQLTLKGPVEFIFLPSFKGKLNEGILVLKYKNIPIQVNFQQIEFGLDPWSVFSNKTKFNSFTAKNLTLKIHLNNSEKNIKIDDMKAKIINTHCDVKLSNLVLHAGGNDFSGSAFVKFNDKIPALEATLYSSHLSLPAENNDETLQFLQLVNAKVDYSIDNLIFNNIKVQNVKLKLSSVNQSASTQLNTEWTAENVDNKGDLKGNVAIHTSKEGLKVTGELRSKELKIKNLSLQDSIHQIAYGPQWVDNLVGKLAKGDLSGRLTWNPSDKTLNAALSLTSANVVDLVNFLQPQTSVSTGSADLNLALTGQGLDFTQWLNSITGNGLITVKNVLLANQQWDARLINLYSALWRQFSLGKNETNIKCAVMRFNAKNGVLFIEDGIGLDTAEIYALGKGQINLPQDSIKLTFQLYPKSEMNIELGTFRNLVYLQGQLSHPEIKASKMGVIKEGGTAILGIATGGLSLLAEKLINIATHKGSACEYVLKKN